MCNSFDAPNNSYGVDFYVVPILQMKKLRHQVAG